MTTAALAQDRIQSQTPTPATTVWEIDPSHSSANFSIRHMMIAKVHGGFTGISGSLHLDSKDLSKSIVEAVIDAASIDTREAKRDEHLKSADFFDVEKFPTLKFKSKKFKKVSDNEFQLVGDLTIRDVTQEVALEVEGLASEMKDPWGNLKRGASAKAKIKRKDFGLNWNAALEAGGVLVGDDVSITLDLQFVKKS